MTPGPNLLVEWEPRWQGFLASIQPALARSKPRLAAECESGMAAGRSTVASFLVHVAVVFFTVSIFTNALSLPSYVHVDPYDSFRPSDYHIVYYHGQDLPQMNDAGGAQAGVSGTSGGRELYNPTQTIRIARGNKPVNTVVDAPSLTLPRTNENVANVLSLPAGPAQAPPMAALQSLMAAANLAPNITPVQASPAAIHDRINAPQMNTEVVQPAPAAAVHERLNSPQLNSSVVQPAPNASRQISGMRLPDTGVIQPVPAPLSATPADMGHTPRLMLPATSVVEPSPNASLPVGNRNVAGPAIASVQVVDAVPPSPNAAGAGSGNGGGMVGSALKALSSLVGSVGGPSGGSGSTAGGGSASAAGAGSGSTPGGGSGSTPGGGGMGLIVSANPGGMIGVPNGEPGSLAMSPNGGKEPGLGGSGGGTGIGRGTGPGSGSHGTGPGSANAGNGLGEGALRPGTSTARGTGGSGSVEGASGIPGVSIKGGHVTLPSFATATSAPGAASRTPGEKRRPPAITIIATSRSGGAVNMYGALKGAKVYTIYIDTQMGMAVLQYAERASAPTDFQQDLTAPEAMQTQTPSDVPKARVLLSCVMDKTGALRNIRTLESAQAEVTQRVIAAIQKWRFRPVLRGDEPVDVDAIVGFNIDTRDNR